MACESDIKSHLIFTMTCNDGIILGPDGLPSRVRCILFQTVIFWCFCSLLCVFPSVCFGRGNNVRKRGKGGGRGGLNTFGYSLPFGEEGEKGVTDFTNNNGITNINGNFYLSLLITWLNGRNRQCLTVTISCSGRRNGSEKDWLMSATHVPFALVLPPLNAIPTFSILYFLIYRNVGSFPHLHCTSKRHM